MGQGKEAQGKDQQVHPKQPRFDQSLHNLNQVQNMKRDQKILKFQLVNKNHKKTIGGENKENLFLYYRYFWSNFNQSQREEISLEISLGFSVFQKILKFVF